MDSESVRSRELGCWNGPEACSGLVGYAGSLEPSHDFEPSDDYVDFLMEIGYGKAVEKELRDFWSHTIKSNYRGDAGKRRICMAAVNLSGRDGLHERLPYITCPVLWMQVNPRHNPSTTRKVQINLNLHRGRPTWYSVSQTLRER